MEINVRVVKILAPQTFTSSRDGSSVVKNTFVGETSGQYPKKIAFSVIGEEKFKQMAIVVGSNYAVSFDVESREWKDKWFTEASAWRAMCIDGAQQQAQQGNAPTPQAPQPQTAPTQAPQAPQASSGNGNGSDDLPF